MTTLFLVSIITVLNSRQLICQQTMDRKHLKRMREILSTLETELQSVLWFSEKKAREAELISQGILKIKKEINSYEQHI